MAAAAATGGRGRGRLRAPPTTAKAPTAPRRLAPRLAWAATASGNARARRRGRRVRIRCARPRRARWEEHGEGEPARRPPRIASIAKPRLCAAPEGFVPCICDQYGLPVLAGCPVAAAVTSRGPAGSSSSSARRRRARWEVAAQAAAASTGAAPWSASRRRARSRRDPPQRSATREKSRRVNKNTAHKKHNAHMYTCTRPRARAHAPPHTRSLLLPPPLRGVHHWSTSSWWCAM